jgi:hypothetical protein
LLVGANGEIDRAHAATAEQAIHPIRSDELALGLLGSHALSGRYCGRLEEVARFLGRGEK